MFDNAFNSEPTICTSVELKTDGLADSIYPISAKIINITESFATIKVYKSVLSNIGDLVFSECAANDVVVHITAEGT